MTAPLVFGDFGDIFEKIHGHQPFQWQTRLLREIVDAPRNTDKSPWPRVIAAPTGAGKTAVIDMALFHLALEARADQRRAPLRIVFAVDRRVVVDQAFDRAKRLACWLAAPVAGPMSAMAEALRSFSDGEPLHVAELRGGLPRESDWARSPAQPTILCTTVDQLGSRLLFRGYGVSPSMAPIHAGLLGQDALIILDEAHLSGAFEDTLGGIRRHGARPASRRIDLPWYVCSLTATPRSEDGVFVLTDEERNEETIARRLKASKVARLVDGGSTAGSDEHLSEFVKQAEDVIAAGKPDMVVAIVVNRVGLARSILERLLAREHDAILLTGRVRPLARDRLVKLYENRLAAGRKFEAERPLFVVATQCIEAGADFDFDAMVTQIAPLDALRQRFGRLDRLGTRGPAPARIVAVKDEVSAKADDPVYGDRAAKTWAWLKSIGPAVDFGPEAMDRLVADRQDTVRDCISPDKRAPVLRQADVNFFAMTNPSPHPDSHLPLFLHGEPKANTDVSIVWRSDLPAHLDGRAKDIVASLPPRSGEALAIPVWKARAWLGKAADANDIGDAEGEKSREAEKLGDRKALRWRGKDNEKTQLITAGELSPGDLIIVPSTYGGCDTFGWDADSEVPVEDIADEAGALFQRRYAAVRLHEALWPKSGSSTPWAQVRSEIADTYEEGTRSVINALLAIVEPSSNIGKQLSALNTAKRLDRRPVAPYDAEDAETPAGLILIAPKGLPEAPTTEDPPDAISETDESGSFARSSSPLSLHVDAVETMVSRFAKSAGLPPRIVEALAFAARHHDDGKADPRFQAWLRGDGPETELLAKSGRAYRRREEARLRKQAGLPEAWRHEVLSVMLAAKRLAAAGEDRERDLILYLIGTHHGHGHPFFEHSDPWEGAHRSLGGIELAPGPGPQRLDFAWQGRDWAEIHAELRARFGTWGLAYLEAIFRLADHRASEAADASTA